ncbi:MAG TPA: 50S ribosomal protein L3 [Candidatus Dojkabacteria bacterium]|nr:50S ribosomal protein L3 [Candidatus Dojkabacteria bacterium]
MKALIGIKKGMTRVFRDNKVVPVTVVDVSNCILSYVEKDGFELGLGEMKKPNRAMTGKYKVAGRVPAKREYFKGSLGNEVEIGSEIKPDMFTAGDKVTVRGVSKGKGFAGVVKRWKFAGGPKTHGQSDRHRAPGSIGAGTDPGRIVKGKRMAGRKGGDTITLLNREIIDVKDNYLLVSGPVPGAKGDLVVIYAK